MGLMTLFRAKWKHYREVRRKAMKRRDQAAIAEIAKNEKDQDVRLEAMERLDTIHREAAKLYETITRLTLGPTVEEVELR
ncbi:MAG: hypothetical protein IH788_05285 [Nitrospinae bacterium]|nr:hypothetical protein [Nitrospinota bacterium]